MKRKLASCFFLTIVLAANVLADSNSLHFYCIASSASNGLVAISPDVVSSCKDYDTTDIENQFHVWVKAYAKELT